MILVELTINGTVYRISNEYVALDHLWEAKIISVTPIRYALPSNAGGYVRPVFGDISLFPDLFDADWPPPESCDIKIMLTDSTEAAAVTVFSGSADRAQIAQDAVTYELREESYTSTLAEKTLIAGDLESVFSTYCGSAYLGLSTDYTNARVSSPYVYRWVDAGKPVIDMLSELAEATNHLFYIDNGTLYLVDMLLDNGTSTVDEFDFIRASYRDPVPYKRFETTGAKTVYSVAGSKGYGDVHSCDVAANVEHIYARFGDNFGNDECRPVHTGLIQYETGKYYEIETRYRRISGTGTIRLGFQGVAADRSTLVNINGSAAYGSAHTITVRDGTSSGWQVKTGYASGWAATGDNTEHPSVASPAVAHTDVAYIRPWALLNYSSETGEFDIDYFRVNEVDSSGNVLNELFFDDFSQGVSPEWDETEYPGSQRETTTSEAAAETRINAHLSNLKTIMERPRMTLEFPLTAEFRPDPGQKISWTDETNAPDELSITAWLRVRAITMDFNKDSLLVEGEGEIS